MLEKTSVFFMLMVKEQENTDVFCCPKEDLRRKYRVKQFSIVIAGGGSTYTPDMLEMLCLVREHFPLRRVVL